MTEKVKAVLDIHEPMTLHSMLERHPDVESVMLADLPSADISIAGVGFERKTVADYVSSMKDGRLEEQVEKLGESYPYSYVLVEGDMEDTDDVYWSDMRGVSIRGHMASLTARDEYEVVAVVPCGEPALLVDYAVRLARKHVEDPTVEYLPTGSVGIDEPAGKQMWGCFSGVGPELAERLWEAFGSPAQFGHNCELEKFSPTGQLARIDGIGEERAQRIVAEIWEDP